MTIRELIAALEDVNAEHLPVSWQGIHEIGVSTDTEDGTVHLFGNGRIETGGKKLLASIPAPSPRKEIDGGLDVQLIMACIQAIMESTGSEFEELRNEIAKVKGG